MTEPAETTSPKPYLLTKTINAAEGPQSSVCAGPRFAAGLSFQADQRSKPEGHHQLDDLAST